MEQSALTSIVLPIAVVLVMLGVGLDLRWSEFARVARRPRGLFAGLITQLAIVPLCAFGVATFFPMPAELAVGIVIIGACPGGAVSNLISYLAGADIALSVSLTTLSSVVTVVTIPLLVNAGMNIWIGGRIVELPILWTSIRLTFLMVLPVGIGMVIRYRFPTFATSAEPFVRRGAFAILGIVIAIALWEYREEIPRYLRILAAPLIALNIATILAGWLAAASSRLDRPQTVTLMIESGIQNGALGITIPAVWIGSAEMSIPPAIYGLLMLLSGSIIIAIAARRRIGGDVTKE